MTFQILMGRWFLAAIPRWSICTTPGVEVLSPTASAGPRATHNLPLQPPGYSVHGDPMQAALARWRTRNGENELFHIWHQSQRGRIHEVQIWKTQL